MEHISFKQVSLNIFKNSLLRRVLVSATIIAISILAYGGCYIFPQFLNQLTGYTEDSAVRVATHLKDRILPDGRTMSMQTFNRDIRPGLPVILCSGYGENFSPADVRKKGLYLFLQKPVSLEALAGIIRKCLDDPEPLL